MMSRILPDLVDQKIEKKIVKKIGDEIKQTNPSSREVAEKLNLSQPTVIKYAHLADLNFRRYEEIPKLTESHKKQRIEFCKKFPFNNFYDWFFVDETYFHLFRNTMDI